MSKAEATLALHLQADERTKRWPWEREYRFAAHATGGTGKGCRQRIRQAGLRDWRFDFALPELGIAVEVEGGAWVQGRHTRGAGFEGDLRKYDAAARLGWTVYRCDPRMIRSGHAVETVAILVEQAIEQRQRAASA